MAEDNDGCGDELAEQTEDWDRQADKWENGF